MLTQNEIARYSRQIILNDFGTKGQINLKNGSAIIIGCGGLGCTAAIYLASTGIGCLGLLDHDTVELSNLHRQIMHSQQSIGKPKCISLLEACKRLNDDILFKAHNVALNSQNAMAILDQYDVIVDATDNVPTRYLLSDACVLLNKPLVSGGALSFEGQLTVYNYEDAACYRCLHPVPPPSFAVANCSDAGIMPPVAGTIGTLQALEVIKILSGLKPSYAKKLFIFDGLNGLTRSVTIRSKQKDCISCGSNRTITHLVDYELFCNAKATDRSSGLSILDKSDRLSVEEYKKMVDTLEPHALIDLRPSHELDICRLLSTTYNIPLTELNKPMNLELIEKLIEKNHVIMVCRRGNDSQLGVEIIKKHFASNKKLNNKFFIKDIEGGLHAWTHNIDPLFPKY